MLEVSGLTKRFGGFTAVSGVSFSLAEGEILGLIGPNGSGKTTLLRALLGLQKISSGEIRLFGEKDLKKALPRVGYVPQRLNLERSFSLSVRKFLSLRLSSTRHWFWQTRQRNDELIRGSLAEIGVESLLEKPLATLSGGQLQRVLSLVAESAEFNRHELDDVFRDVLVFDFLDIPTPAIGRVGQKLPRVQVLEELGGKKGVALRLAATSPRCGFRSGIQGSRATGSASTRQSQGWGPVLAGCAQSSQRCGEATQ